MPVIVIGGDTPIGRAVIEALGPEGREVRAFVSSVAAAEELKQRGVKVAIGDVSDGSHVGGAALRAYTAVAIADAAVDDRERAFAKSPEAVVAAWAEGLLDAGVSRIIWLDDRSVDDAASVLGKAAPVATVITSGRDHDAIAAEVVDLDEAAEV